MGRRRVTESRSVIDISAVGDLGIPDEREAILRAQRKNAEIAEVYVKDLAQREVKGYSAFNDRVRNRDYPGSMADWYRAEVTPEGDVELTNPTERAIFFEEGTQRHEIWASGVFSRGSRGPRRPPRGLRGQFTRGARALNFQFIDGTEFIGVMVDHPGQAPNPIAFQTMEDNLPIFAENIADELEREVRDA